MRHRHAFFIAEGIIGMGLLALAAGVLFVGITRQGFASHTLAAARAATRVAEATLARLQSHLPLPASDARIEIHPIPESASVNASHWVEVTATVGSQTRSLIGLAPDDSPRTAPAERSAP